MHLGITQTQLDTLRLIEGGTTRQRDLAKARGVSRQNVSACIRAMRDRKLVTQDGVEVSVTDLGRIMIDSAVHYGEAETAWAWPVSTDPRQALREVLPELTLPCTVDTLHSAVRGDCEAAPPRHAVLRAARQEGLVHTRSAQRCRGCSSRHYIVHRPGQLSRDWLCGACTEPQTSVAA